MLPLRGRRPPAPSAAGIALRCHDGGAHVAERAACSGADSPTRLQGGPKALSSSSPIRHASTPVRFLPAPLPAHPKWCLYM